MKKMILFMIVFILPVLPVNAFESGNLGVVVVEKDEAIQIRSLTSMANIQTLGGTQRIAIELAAHDFGNIYGREIELGSPLGSDCSSEGGIRGAQEIIADARVIGVIGTSCSVSAVVASPIISEAGLVMVSPSNTSPVLTADLEGNQNSKYFPGYFRVSSNDLYQARAVADFAYNELGLRRMGALHDGDPYTESLASAFINAFRTLGGEVLSSLQVEKGDEDMSGILEKFKDVNPDGIFFPLFSPEGLPFVNQLRESEDFDDVVLITGATLLESDFLADSHTEGIYGAGPETDLADNLNSITGKNSEQVLEAYKNLQGGLPDSPFWPHAYDATTLLLNAIRSVAVEEDGILYIDRAELRERLSNASFQGLLGKLSCKPFGDCGTGRINIYHHLDSKITNASRLKIVYQFVP